MRINIHSRNDNNTINEKEYPKFDNSSIRLKAEGGLRASENVRIIFEPSAVKPLFESIGWGARYRQGNVEQAGILIGNYYRDRSSDDEVIWADVVIVIPADPALVNASFETIDITVDAWQKMYEEAAACRLENLQIIGWYHTHLSSISTRFSAIDRNTQRKAFTYQYSFGIVFNPNQRKWSAFYGPESRECVGELLFDEELENKYGVPQIMIRQVNGDSELQEDGSVVHIDERGYPVANNTVNQKIPEKAEEDILSFPQLIHQFKNGVVRLMKKPPKGNKELPCPQSADSPKIEIRNREQTVPVVECEYYSMSTDNRMVKDHDFAYTVKTSFVKEIARQKSPDRKFLWGTVKRSGSGIEVLPVGAEKKQMQELFLRRIIQMK